MSFTLVSSYSLPYSPLQSIPSLVLKICFRYTLLCQSVFNSLIVIGTYFKVIFLVGSNSKKRTTPNFENEFGVMPSSV